MKKAIIILLTSLALIILQSSVSIIHSSSFTIHCFAQDETVQDDPVKKDDSVDNDDSADDEDMELDKAELEQIDPWLLEPSEPKK